MNLNQLLLAAPTPTSPAPKGPVIPSDSDYGKTSSCVAHKRLFCWDWFKQNWNGTIEPKLIEHIELTLIAVGIGFAISFLLAVLAHRNRWLATPVTLLGSLLFTIPSIATFEILVTVTGINKTTVEIALVSYTLLILFTNTLAGLSGVSPDVLDAARGIGLNKRQILWRVELPLALPTIIAGLRVTVVTIISLATVAAFIIPSGLGKIITDALSNNTFKTGLVSGGVLCVLLAIVADALLATIQRLLTPWARARRAGLGAA